MNQRVLGVVLGLVAVVGGFFAISVALVWQWAACCSESNLEPSAASEYQVGVAVLGLIPAVCTVVSGLIWPRLGSPWFWFCTTAVVYAAWLVYAAIALS